MCSQWDDPRVCECDWTSPSAVDGLGLVPDRSFFPHYEDMWASLVMEHAPSLDHRVTTLPQEGGAFVSGGRAPTPPRHADAADLAARPRTPTTAAATLDAWSKVSQGKWRAAAAAAARVAKAHGKEEPAASLAAAAPAPSAVAAAAA